MYSHTNVTKSLYCLTCCVVVRGGSETVVAKVCPRICRKWRDGAAESTGELFVSFLSLHGEGGRCPNEVARLGLDGVHYVFEALQAAYESELFTLSSPSVAAKENRYYNKQGCFLHDPSGFWSALSVTLNGIDCLFHAPCAVCRASGGVVAERVVEPDVVPAAALPQGLRRKYAHRDAPSRGRGERPHHTPLAHLLWSVRDGRR